MPTIPGGLISVIVFAFVFIVGISFAMQFEKDELKKKNNFNKPLDKSLDEFEQKISE